ncbi:Hypothetical predicted protein, partial [Pelobates cultripes]
ATCNSLVIPTVTAVILLLLVLCAHLTWTLRKKAVTAACESHRTEPVTQERIIYSQLDVYYLTNRK